MPANGNWTYTGIYLSHGTVVLSASGTVFVNGAFYGPAGGGNCTGALVPYLPCNSLIGEIGNGPYFAIPNTDYLHVFQSGSLRLAVNTPSGAYSWSAFHVGVVALPQLIRGHVRGGRRLAPAAIACTEPSHARSRRGPPG